MENQNVSDTERPPRRPPLSARKNVQAGYLRLLLDVLMEEGSPQRGMLAQRVGLSRLAISELLAGLEETGFVEVHGALGGAPGRSERRYSLRAQAAAAAGFDIGGSKMAGALVDIRGTVLAEVNESTLRTGRDGLVAQVNKQLQLLCDAAHVPRWRVRSVAVGLPAAVHPIDATLSLADNLPGLEDGDFPAALRQALGLSVLIDNDVNLALLGELVQRKGKARDNVAFVALGTGIGGALVVDGKLLRGAHGGAGEVGYLPLWPELTSGVPALEEQVGEAGIRRAYVAAGGPPDHSVREIFDAAASGSLAARDTLDITADHVARALMTILALVDPDRIVLGGSVGARLELIERVRSRLAQRWMRPIDIERSESGSRAGLLGAVEMAHDNMLRTLFGARPDHA